MRTLTVRVFGLLLHAWNGLRWCNPTRVRCHHRAVRHTGRLRTHVDRLVALHYGANMVQRPVQLPEQVDPDAAMRVLTVVNWLRRYHRYQVEGLENVPLKGPTLLVVHHSFATYDVAMLGVTIWESCQRVCRALADRLIFKIPILADEARKIGAVVGDPATAKKLLRDGELVMVAPGGMREALRSSEQKHTLAWGNRVGFARLAIETGATLVPAACPAADEIFTLTQNRLTDFLYQRLHIPVPLLRGLGPTPLPRPVPLTHYVGKPIVPPAAAKRPAALQTQAVALQQKVAAAMMDLLQA